MKLRVIFVGMLIAGTAGFVSAQTWDGGKGEPLMAGVAVIRNLAEKTLSGKTAAVPEPASLSVKALRDQGELVSKKQSSPSANTTWVSRSMFSKTEALEYAEKVRIEFERAGIKVVSIGTYNNFESTGFFKHRAMVVYVGDYKIVKSYKSPWYKTKAECDQAMTQISLQLSRQGAAVIDASDYREGDETGKFYVFSIDYLQAGV